MTKHVFQNYNSFEKYQRKKFQFPSKIDRISFRVQNTNENRVLTRSNFAIEFSSKHRYFCRGG